MTDRSSNSISAHLSYRHRPATREDKKLEEQSTFAEEMMEGLEALVALLGGFTLGQLNTLDSGERKKHSELYEEAEALYRHAKERKLGEIPTKMFELQKGMEIQVSDGMGRRSNEVTGRVIGVLSDVVLIAWTRSKRGCTRRFYAEVARSVEVPAWANVEDSEHISLTLYTDIEDPDLVRSASTLDAAWRVALDSRSRLALDRAKDEDAEIVTREIEWSKDYRDGQYRRLFYGR